MTQMKKCSWLPLFLILAALRSYGQGPDMDLYLLIGQSNMAGRAEITDELTDPLNRVFLFTNDPSVPWKPAANPLNIYSTIRKDSSMQKLGPGYTFARRMALENEPRPVGLIVNARGGSGIREWLPGTDYYSEAVRRARLAMEYGVLKGIVWLQGESDLNRLDQYPSDLLLLIRSLRRDLEAEEIPFVACELAEDKPGREDFNVMLNGLAEKIPYYSVAKTADLSTMDSTHFDTSSQVLIGERMAVQMIQIQNALHVE